MKAPRPRIVLLDARERSLDEDALREHARAVCARAQTAFASRSYRFPFAAIALHDAPVGVDIERAGPHDDVFAESIGTPAERAAGLPAEDRDRHIASLWCSKEALSKALGDPLAYDPRRLEAPLAWPDGESGRWRAAEIDAPAGHVAWVCWQA